MKNKNNIPVWYRMMIERRIKKLENALNILDFADECLNASYNNVAKTCFNYAVEYSKK